MTKEQIDVLVDGITDYIWTQDAMKEYQKDEMKFVLDYIENLGDECLKNHEMSTEYTCSANDVEIIVQMVDSWAEWRYK